MQKEEILEIKQKEGFIIPADLPAYSFKIIEMDAATFEKQIAWSLKL